MLPALPLRNVWAGHFLERLQEITLDEARDQEAVEAGDIRAGAGGEIERELLRQLLVLAAELGELDGDVLAFGLHLLGKGRNDLLFDPLGHAAVYAADDASAGDVKLGCHGRPGQGHDGCRAQQI
ncbi:hypothetical protein D9M70_603140 [compost metagenome]